MRGSVGAARAEPAALQRRFTQLEEMIRAMESPDDHGGRVPTSSVISEDIFMFEGHVDSTSVDSNASEQSAVNVFLSFPTKWSSDVTNVYLALYSARFCGRPISDSEICSWTGLSVQKVRCSLRELVHAGKAQVEDSSGWTCS